MSAVADSTAARYSERRLQQLKQWPQRQRPPLQQKSLKPLQLLVAAVGAEAVAVVGEFVDEIVDDVVEAWVW